MNNHHNYRCQTSNNQVKQNCRKCRKFPSTTSASNTTPSLHMKWNWLSTKPTMFCFLLFTIGMKIRPPRRARNFVRSRQKPARATLPLKHTASQSTVSSGVPAKWKFSNFSKSPRYDRVSFQRRLHGHWRRRDSFATAQVSRISLN